MGPPARLGSKLPTLDSHRRMDDFTIARTIHIFSVLMWIGGVAFVTLIVIPSIRLTYPPGERLSAFELIEGRFAPQARIWVLLAGASGFWMVYRGQMWSRFVDPQFWWMHAMSASGCCSSSSSSLLNLW